MIVPSKFTSLDRSILARLPRVLEAVSMETRLQDLCEKTIDVFEDPGEFLLAIDLLYLLAKIEVDFKKETVRLC